MSEEQKTETPPEETLTDSSKETQLESQDTGGANEQAEQETIGVVFDAATFESDYGLPEGSLKDAQDEAAALEIVRTHADRLLQAGLITPQQRQDVQQATKQETPKPNEQKAGGESNPELDALRAELQEVKGILTQQSQATQRNMEQALDNRIEAEIDKWSSPKYGTSKTRNFNQLKASRELRDLIRTHVVGLQNTGQKVPRIEAVLKQVRAFHDEDYNPRQKNPNPGEQKPLGTPGASRDRGGDNQPRNIHSVLLGHK